jgi:hypothetical protein
LLCNMIFQVNLSAYGENLKMWKFEKEEMRICENEKMSATSFLAVVGVFTIAVRLKKVGHPEPVEGTYSCF